MNADLIKYYDKRALEYELIYSKPERQEDLKTTIRILQEAVKGKKVLEFGCGTGYWTEKIAVTAASVLATDINESVLEIARHKNYPANNVAFGIADMYRYIPTEKYNCLFGGFTWSHIKLTEISNFLQRINQLISPGGTVIFIDNNFISSSSTPIDSTDQDGNTYQLRQLNDGSCHRVLKNFPGECFIKSQVSNLSANVSFTSLQYFWILLYSIPLTEPGPAIDIPGAF